MYTLHEITDFSDPALDVYARLTENQLVNRADPQNAVFIAESPVVIERALDAGCVPVSMLMESRHVAGKGAHILGYPGLRGRTAGPHSAHGLSSHARDALLHAAARPPLR